MKARNPAEGLFRPQPGEEKRAEALIDRLRSLTRAGRRYVLYKLLCNLYGKNPQGEVGIFDPSGRDYGVVVPPERWGNLEYLEHPEWHEQDEQAAKQPARATSAMEIIERAKASLKEQRKRQRPVA
jgi:hypothetical protein